MAARRCPIGCESWPDKALFITCRICGEHTERVENIDPTITFEEGRLIVLYDEFEKYYERRCAVKGITVDGPLEAAASCS